MSPRHPVRLFVHCKELVTLTAGPANGARQPLMGDWDGPGDPGRDDSPGNAQITPMEIDAYFAR